MVNEISAIICSFASKRTTIYYMMDITFRSYLTKFDASFMACAIIFSLVHSSSACGYGFLIHSSVVAREKPFLRGQSFS